MNSRQGTTDRSLYLTCVYNCALACAVAFVFMTYVHGSAAQSSSRRNGLQSPQKISQPQPVSPQPHQPQTVTRPQSFDSATPMASPITTASPTRTAEANPVESPMAREIRNQLKKQRSFQNSVQSRPSRSRALYNIRIEGKQQDTQTVEELLEEMDRRPPQSQQSQANPTQEAIEPADTELTLDPNHASTQSPPEINSDPPLNTPVLPQATDSEFEPDQPTSLPDVTNPLSSDLTYFEYLAMKNHPTLNASRSRIATAQHEALQAGLHPNPRLGLFIDEAGNENDPGLWGAFLQRRHIRGNKLALGREIKNREANVREVEFETQAIRIRTDVRTAFYKLLIAKEKMELMTQLYQNQQKAVAKSKQLFEAGEPPRTDLLQTKLQLQRTEILLSQLEITRQNAWRELASVVGDPNLEPRDVSEDLTPIIEAVSFEECRNHILSHSPELQLAQAEMERLRYTIEREIAETIPDYQTQLTVGRDSATNHFFTGLQIQVPLQVCDQNQGNIAAAKSRLVAAQNDLERIKLDLSKRLSSEYRKYESALIKSKMYLNQLLPNAKQTLELLEQGYPSEVSFLQLSTAQQSVIDLTVEYLDTLNLVWQSRLKIEGLLLDDSLSK